MMSIFQRKNPAIEKLFAEAGSPRKVMCIPIDYAKAQHTALVCNGEGLQLRSPFHIHNSPLGIDFLEEIVAGLCRKHSIRKAHVFFGGEDCSAIAFNFIHALLQKRYPGIGIHARDAALERAWDKVLIKWRDTASIQQALATGTPLEEWRLFLNERYGLKLSKLSPQYDRLRNR